MARYEVDPLASEVDILARSTIHPVHIQARGLTGVLEGQLGRDGRIKIAAPHHAKLSIPVENLRSGNPLQDMEMDRRMDAAQFPTIDCEVDRLAGDGSGAYTASGRLVVHGQARDVEAEITLTAVSRRQVVIEVEHVFDMRDFGVSPPRLLMLRVDPVVRVKVRVEARSG